MDLCTIILGLIVLIFVFIYRHLTKNRGHLETLGIPVEKPFLLFGSPPFALHKVLFHEHYINKFREHGKTYCRYDGTRPTIVTIDTDIIKSVLVKNFDSFTETFDIPVLERHATLDISGGEQWRDLRKNLSPTFTSGKLKSMMEPIERLADNLVDYVEELRAKNSTVDVKPVFQCFALETICACAFGVQTDPYRNPEHGLLKSGKEIFAGFRASNWTQSLILQSFSYIPGMEKIIPIIPPGFDKFFEVTQDIIKGRESGNIVRDDFVAKIMEMVKEKRENAESLKSLTKDMIISQGIVFFIAGYETTSSTLSTFFYNMAKHPDIQDKVYEEITRVTESHDGKVDGDTLGQMEYLDACVSENFRLNGPVILHSRICIKDCEVVPGMKIKKGMRVDMPIYPCHHNPEYFPDPESFIPERFLKNSKIQEIPQYAFRPFGGGPRLCIGQRFSQIELKMGIVKMLLKYRILPVEETRLDFFKGDNFKLTFPEVKVKVELRVL